MSTNNPASQPVGEKDTYSIEFSIENLTKEDYDKIWGILEDTKRKLTIKRNGLSPSKEGQPEPVKVKLGERFVTYSSLKDKSIPQEWHQIWHEIEVWYGDVRKEESAENLINRLRQILISASEGQPDAAIATGLFTEEQKKYVAGVKDEDLRANLLHQVRLRDNMEADRNNFEAMLKESGRWVFGVDINWQIKCDPKDLSNVMKSEDCRFIGDYKECEEFIQKYKPSAQQPVKTKDEWKLIGHSSQIADTGDYDGCYELTNGKISIFTKDDDDEALSEIVKVFNLYDINFYLDDSHEWEIFSLKQQLSDREGQQGARWVNLSDKIYPKQEEEVFWDGGENPPAWGRFRTTGKFNYVVLLDSSGEEELTSIDEYERWLDESQSHQGAYREALERVQREYIEFLNDAYTEAFGVASVHGYRETLERLTKGIELRKRIAEALSSPALPSKEVAIEILKELCQLKHYKDTVGKDAFYERRQPELWKEANDYLNKVTSSSQPGEEEAGQNPDH